MSAPTFTKGPWTAEREDKSCYAVTSEDYGVITRVHQPLFPDVAKHDAHLIAAAPDLFEACAEFVRKCENGEARSTRSYQQMKAALAKARGEK